MAYPYTPDPVGAFAAAQASVAAVLTALVWFRPLRPKLADALFVAAVWIAALAPLEPDVLAGLGAKLDPDHLPWLLRMTGVLAALAMLVAKRWLLSALAVLGQVALSYVASFVKDAPLDLAALQVV